MEFSFYQRLYVHHIYGDVVFFLRFDDLLLNGFTLLTESNLHGPGHEVPLICSQLIIIIIIIFI